MKKEEVLGKLPDLDNVLTPLERQQVLDEMHVHEYRKNEPIYSEGDRPTHLLCLISGKVKIYKDGVGGRAQIVRVVNAVEYFMRNPQLAWFFLRRLAIALGKSDARTVNLTQKHIRGRLAESILFLKENYGMEEDGQTLSVYPSREDMANLSNMTTSNAIRTLSVFAQEGLISLDGRRIKLLNEPALQKISRMG